MGEHPETHLPCTAAEQRPSQETPWALPTPYRVWPTTRLGKHPQPHHLNSADKLQPGWTRIWAPPTLCRDQATNGTGKLNKPHPPHAEANWQPGRASALSPTLPTKQPWPYHSQWVCAAHMWEASQLTCEKPIEFLALEARGVALLGHMEHFLPTQDYSFKNEGGSHFT